MRSMSSAMRPSTVKPNMLPNVIISVITPTRDTPASSVNLNKAFSENQPHSFAVLAGLVAGPAVVSLGGIVALAGMTLLDSHLAALLLLLLWSAATFLLARILLPAAAELYERRREAVLMTNQGR